MKKRFLAFALAAIALIGTARVLTPQPIAPREEPTLVERVIRFVAFRWIQRKFFQDDPAPQQVEQTPERDDQGLNRDDQDPPPMAYGSTPHVARQQTATEVSQPKLDHAAGW